MRKILLGQLGANGDCAYATILARQLRHDHPDAHLTWAVSSQCAGLLKNNPHIDEIWEIPISGWDQHDVMWRVFEREATRRYLRREFDEILLSQIWPNNFQNFDGTVRPSILRSFGRPITVPIENVIRLTDDEIEKVKAYVESNAVEGFEHRILFECSAKSGQSFVTPDLAQEIAQHVYTLLPNTTIMFSTHQPMELKDTRSRYAGGLSIREIAHLTHYATLFVGAGSGCTVIATSTAAKPLPFVLLLSPSTSVFASFAHDFEYFGINHPGIIEITNSDPVRIANCIARVCREGATPALMEFGGCVPISFDHYMTSIELCLLRQQRYLDAARSLLITARRYSWTGQLVQFGERRIAPYLEFDPTWFFAENRAFGDYFRTILAEAVRHPAREPVQCSAIATGEVSER